MQPTSPYCRMTICWRCCASQQGTSARLHPFPCTTRRSRGAFINHLFFVCACCSEIEVLQSLVGHVRLKDRLPSLSPLASSAADLARSKLPSPFDLALLALQTKPCAVFATCTQLLRLGVEASNRHYTELRAAALTYVKALLTVGVQEPGFSGCGLSRDIVPLILGYLRYRPAHGVCGGAAAGSSSRIPGLCFVVPDPVCSGGPAIVRQFKRLMGGGIDSCERQLVAARMRYDCVVELYRPMYRDAPLACQQLAERVQLLLPLPDAPPPWPSLGPWGDGTEGLRSPPPAPELMQNYDCAGKNGPRACTERFALAFPKAKELIRELAYA
jgi:hypothetical protein